MDGVIEFFKLELMGVALWIWGLALLVIVAIVLLIIIIVKVKNRGVVVVEEVKIKNGQRYTKHEHVATKDQSVSITHLEKDFILKRGVVYVAKKGGQLLPGKYSILTTEENTPKFNIRLGGFVREYQHNADIVIGDGEEICSVSHTTILR